MPLRPKPTRLALLAAACAAALPAAAAAETTYTARGAGFGHGVGMSQYGAEGMARKGASHREILARYYPGTRLGRASTDRTRVLLIDGAPVVELSGAARIPGRRSLDRDRVYRASQTATGRVELRTGSGRLVGRYTAPLAVDGRGAPVRLGGPALNGVTGGEYRGATVLHPGAGGLTVVNLVGLEDYLRGVVPGEMPSSWRREALRAQAVAARSYALATARRGGLFDQYPDTRSQVYKGVHGEQPETDAAVTATAARVVLHGSVVATTFFHSTSGGRTETSANAFGGPAQPYLRSIADAEDRLSPHHRWAVSFTAGEIERRLGSLVDGRYRGVRVLDRGASPRVLRAEVVGTRGRRPTTGATLRARLGLRDTWAYFGRIDTSAAGAEVAPRSPTVGSAPAGVLTGRVVPVPRGGAIRVERLAGARWRRVERAHTDRRGAFRVAVERSGRYRVVAEGAAGATVVVSDSTRRRAPR